ncbi:hypothetical protein, partial [Enterococcus faecalis]|uniref:hypothetical protein n=1 Tax=Enterococcus faecalis TaxID=1351 RepID=UPI001AD77ED3
KIKSTMRKVKTSEDGLYRTIKKRKCEPYYQAVFAECVKNNMTPEQAHAEAMGLPMVSVDLNIPYDADKEWIKLFKTQLFKEGFTDVATGYHYIFLKATPSETRTGCATFVYAETWDDVHKLWYEFTGLGTYETFRDAFDTDNGVNIVKMLARFSSRGSNSHPTMELYDETHAEAIKNTRVLFVVT